MNKNTKTAVALMMIMGAVSIPAFSKTLSTVKIGDVSIKLGTGVLLGLPEVDVEVGDSTSKKSPKQEAKPASRPAEPAKPEARVEPKKEPEHKEPASKPEAGKGEPKNHPDGKRQEPRREGDGPRSRDNGPARPMRDAK